MERVLSVFLCRDITRDDTCRIARWLQSSNVSENLCEAEDISESIITLGESVPQCMLSMRLSNGGPFFMIGLPRTDPDYGESDMNEYLDNAEYTDSVGFLKLTEHGCGNYEITIAVGEQQLWGRGIGTASVRRSLDHAFCELRASSVTANIKRFNSRSLAVFRRLGFRPVSEGDQTVRYLMTRSDYITSKTRGTRLF